MSSIPVTVPRLMMRSISVRVRHCISPACLFVIPLYWRRQPCVSIMLVTSGSWSSSTAMLSGVDSGPVNVHTNKVRHLLAETCQGSSGIPY